MGRKVKRLSEEQAREALVAVEEAFKSFSSISELIDENFTKSSYMPQMYTNVWRALLKFQVRMELEVERACLG
jgi:hypothetical protein